MISRFVFHEMANVLCSQESSLKDLLTPLIKHTLSANKIDPALIGDLVIGNVLPPSSMGATEVRAFSIARRTRAITSPDTCPPATQSHLLFRFVLPACLAACPRRCPS